MSGVTIIASGTVWLMRAASMRSMGQQFQVNRTPSMASCAPKSMMPRGGGEGRSCKPTSKPSSSLPAVLPLGPSPAHCQAEAHRRECQQPRKSIRTGSCRARDGNPCGAAHVHALMATCGNPCGFCCPATASAHGRFAVRGKEGGSRPLAVRNEGGAEARARARRLHQGSRPDLPPLGYQRRAGLGPPRWPVGAVRERVSKRADRCGRKPTDRRPAGPQAAAGGRLS